MDPPSVFCPNVECPARGQVGRGNIRIHSQREGRYQCWLCGKTFSERHGTPVYRRRTDPETMALVLTLVTHGCPPLAVEAAFGIPARTVRDWVQAAGSHCQPVHQHRLLPQALEHVPADELRVKLQGRIVWLGMALAVASRLWRGAVVGASRDRHLLRAIAAWVRAWSLPGPLLLVADGLAGYVDAFRRAFRSPQRERPTGRPKLLPWEGVVIGPVVKQ